MTNNMNQNPTLAKPFSQIFADRAEADAAFDLLRQTAEWLGLTTPYDARLVVSYSERFLHLDFGNWLVIGFEKPERVTLALLTQQVHWDSHIKSYTYDHREDEPEVGTYDLPISMVKPMSAELQTAYRLTLDFIAHKFQNWKSSNYSRHHNPEIAEAMLDLAKRERLFNEGLPGEEFVYERHLTVFGHSVNEEGENYQITPERKNLFDTTEQLKVKFKFPQIAESPKNEPSKIMPSATNPTYTLAQLATDTCLDQNTLERWLRAINRKGQAILYGPPGTGKTYIAEHLAQHLISGGDGFMELVQFHPSYAYEDFMQGLRPQVVDGQLTYHMVKGRFMEFCHQAQGCKNICVLIIDEINRANLSRVFGELMYLLEYRDKTITLAGGEPFAIPSNVRLIGTMNTADRSIALVDHALRRRFAFLRLWPNFEALRQYHQKTGFNVEGLVKRLNEQINDPHHEVGITFFMHPNLADHLADIWQMEIEPYLEEHFFDQLDKVDEFRWKGKISDKFA